MENDTYYYTYFLSFQDTYVDQPSLHFTTSNQADLSLYYNHKSSDDGMVLTPKLVIAALAGVVFIFGAFILTYACGRCARK